MKTHLEAVTALHSMRQFIGASQKTALRDLFRGEEKQFFFDKLCELSEIIKAMPVTYEQDGKGEHAIVYLHYFTAGADWHITEKDSMDEQVQAFGQANLGYGAELGYINIEEILACGAELDFHFTPKPLAEVNHIGLMESAIVSAETRMRAAIELGESKLDDFCDQDFTPAECPHGQPSDSSCPECNAEQRAERRQEIENDDRAIEGRVL